MTTPIWLTDEDSEVPGYKRAKVPFITTQPNKSDCPSLVRAVTNSVLGPANIPVARTIGSAVFNQGWLTDPLNGPVLSSGVWVFHVWAQQSNALANIGLACSVSKWNGGSVVSAQMSSELGTTTADINLSSGAATPVAMSPGDRLLIQLSLVDTGGVMQAGYNATVSYNGLYSRTEGDTWVQAPDTLLTVGTQPNTEIVGDIPDDDVNSVRTVLRDAGNLQGLSSYPSLDDQEIIRYIIQAVETYSVDRPYIASYLYSGDGNTFDFPLPPLWIWGFSRITAIEYPAAQQIPNSLEYLDWEIRDEILGTQPVRKLRMRTIIPDNTVNNLYVQYSTRHKYSTEFSTIPREDQDAVMWLAASYCAQAVSARYAGSTDSSLDADVVNYGSLQTKWADVSDRLMKMYLKRVVEPDSATPVGSLQEWRPVLESGQAMLWHSRRIRRVFY